MKEPPTPGDDVLHTWSTLFSVFGTGGLTRVPLTADTDQAYYRVRE